MKLKLAAIAVALAFPSTALAQERAVCLAPCEPTEEYFYLGVKYNTPREASEAQAKAGYGADYSTVIYCTGQGGGDDSVAGWKALHKDTPYSCSTWGPALPLEVRTTYCQTQTVSPPRFIGWWLGVSASQPYLATTLDEAVASPLFQQSYPGYKACGYVGGQTTWVCTPQGVRAFQYDFSPYARYDSTLETKPYVEDNVDGFGPMGQLLIRNDSAPNSDSQPATSEERGRETPQRRIEVGFTGNRVVAVRPFGAKVTFTNGVPNRGTDKLTKIAGGWTYRTVDGSVETYNAKGILLKSVTLGGVVTLITPDARGREILRKEKAGTANEQWFWTEWHSTYNLPKRTAGPKEIRYYTYGEPTHPTPSLRGELLNTKVQPTSDLSGKLGFKATPVGAQFTDLAITYNGSDQVTKMSKVLGATATSGTETVAFIYNSAKALTQIDVTAPPPPSSTPSLFLVVDKKFSFKPFGPDKGFCGSGFSEVIVPDNASTLRLDFKAACKAHDECYGRCGSNKGKCDQALQVAMLTTCNVYKNDPTRFEPCVSWAKTYWWFVNQYGGSPFREAQRNCLPGKCQQ